MPEPAGGAQRLKLGVLVSGSGTNLQAIIDACADGSLDAEVAVVVSDKSEAFGLERARHADIAAVHVARADHPDAASFNLAIRDALVAAGVDFVVMAGYMRLLGTEVLSAFPMRVLNLHPALLPSFPGAHGIADAFAYGVKVTGVTVHFANEVFDEGPIITQVPVVIEESDTVETLEAKIHAVEHVLYPAALQLLAEGRVRIEGRAVRILPGA
jgi:phosphoribosylglycinamide formyltransferase-1